VEEEEEEEEEKNHFFQTKNILWIPLFLSPSQSPPAKGQQTLQKEMKYHFLPLRPLSNENHSPSSSPALPKKNK